MPASHVEQDSAPSVETLPEAGGLVGLVYGAGVWGWCMELVYGVLGLMVLSGVYGGCVNPNSPQVRQAAMLVTPVDGPYVDDGHNVQLFSLACLDASVASSSR